MDAIPSPVDAIASSAAPHPGREYDTPRVVSEPELLSDWPGFESGPLPYPIAGNDHVASLVPIQYHPSRVIDVTENQEGVSIWTSRTDRIFFSAPQFPRCWSRPPGCLVHSGLLDVYGDDWYIPAMVLDAVPWLKTSTPCRFAYGSHDPDAPTYFDGHNFTPLGSVYVDSLPGASCERAFLPELGVVVWLGTYDGRRFVSFQTANACETDPNWVGGVRVSAWTPRFNTVPIVHYPKPPTAWNLVRATPDTQNVFNRRVLPFFRTDDGYFTYSTDSVFEGFVREWTEVRKVTPLLSGHYAVHGLGVSEIVSISLPHGNVSPALALQGFWRPGDLPGYQATIVYRMSVSYDKKQRFGVDLSDDYRRFAISSRQVIQGDCRYALRKLKIHKAPFPDVTYVVYSYDTPESGTYVPVDYLPSSKPFFSNDVSEENDFSNWYYKKCYKVYTIVAWEYACGSLGYGDILLRSRRTGNYYCVEIKKDEKGSLVWIQAWKYAVYFAAFLRRIGREDKVIPCALVNGNFFFARHVTDADIAEYNRGKQVWYDLGRFEERFYTTKAMKQ